MPMKCGGLAEPVEADAKVQELIEKVKPHAEEKAGQAFEAFAAVSYSKQVVSGVNYFVKVFVGGDNHVHLRIFEPLPHSEEVITLSDVQLFKTLHDPIVYF